MIKRILVIFLIPLALPVLGKVGENKDFWILSQKDYDLRVSNGKDVIFRRYILVPQMNTEFKTIFESNSNEDILSKFSYLLKKNKSKYINEYMLKYDKYKEINLLIKGLYYFSKKQYSEAIESLNHFNLVEYNFLKYQLIADCQYELLSNKPDYKQVIKHYQAALDFAESETSKTVINNRIKFIKYR